MAYQDSDELARTRAELGCAGALRGILGTIILIGLVYTLRGCWGDMFGPRDLRVGQVMTLSSPDLEVGVPVAEDELSLISFLSSIQDVTWNEARFNQLEDSGQIWFINRETQVKVLKRSYKFKGTEYPPEVQIFKLKIIEGPHKGKVVWVDGRALY